VPGYFLVPYNREHTHLQREVRMIRETSLKETPMKHLLALLALVSTIIILNAQTSQSARAQAQAATPAPPKPVTAPIFIDKAKVAGVFAKGGNLVNAPDMIVLGSHRAVPGQVEVHDKETDLIYVIEGAATFVMGGKMVGGKVTRPAQWMGTDITGGQTQKLTKGDMVIVPAGIPHWFKEVSPEISYYVVKVVKP
jgi:mannose-6-phosphate isomerase-like protein (cupin superfamily)